MQGLVEVMGCRDRVRACVCPGISNHAVRARACVCTGQTG